MALLSGWPAITDDTTVYNKAFFDAIKASVEANVHSSTNPTITLADLIDEVVTARGTTSSLDARISGVIDDDGVFISPGSAVSQDQLENVMGKQNILNNGTFMLWGEGDSEIPSHWLTESGTLAYQKCGIGLVDTERKVGPYCARLSPTGVSKATSYVVDANAMAVNDHTFADRYVSISGWIKCSETGHATLGVADGTGETKATHTGSGTWEYLSTTRLIDSSPTVLAARVTANKTSPVYVSGISVTMSDVAPTRYHPMPWSVSSFCSWTSGAVPVEDDHARWFFPVNAQIISAYASCLTAPGAGGVEIEIEKYETGGPSWLTVASGVIIANGDIWGGLTIPLTEDNADDAYTGGHHHGLLRLNIVSATTAADLNISIGYRHPQSENRMWKIFGDE